MIYKNKKLNTFVVALTMASVLIGQPITKTIPGTEVTFQLTKIPAGTFEMSDGEKSKTIRLDAFYIGTHEVTWDEFLIFQQKENDSEESLKAAYNVDAVTRPTPPYEDFSKGMGKRGGFPAVSMTQQAALRYCEWLFQKTGEFYRLPTEAEWEYACRAGKDSDFHFGNEVDDLAEYDWYYENGDEKYHKVGKKKANSWGLYDMHGNVSEWTLDDYVADYLGQFEEGNLVNPWMKPKMRHYRTVKGGSYYTDAEECSCTFRLKSKTRWQMRDPQIPKSLWWNTDSPFVGFRLVKPTKKMTTAEIEAFFKEAIVD